ncbi:MAG: hypothetical protein HDS84_00865 [Bacteroidales bacterium]|nr:hypothetical protein [Bacteroidales bacterium]
MAVSITGRVAQRPHYRTSGGLNYRTNGGAHYRTSVGTWRATSGESPYIKHRRNVKTSPQGSDVARHVPTFADAIHTEIYAEIHAASHRRNVQTWHATSLHWPGATVAFS